MNVYVYYKFSHKDAKFKMKIKMCKNKKKKINCAF